jgi:hypothetical protein
MERDRALKKAVKNSVSDILPYGFENRVMKQVFHETEKKKKKIYLYGIFLASFVSLIMIAGCVLLLSRYFGLKFSLDWIQLNISGEAFRTLVFFGNIAIVVLILLFIDAYLRKLKHKHQTPNT